MTHETFVLIARAFGLFYLMGFFRIVVIQPFRPSRKANAGHAARSILNTADRPWQQRNAIPSRAV